MSLLRVVVLIGARIVFDGLTLIDTPNLEVTVVTGSLDFELDVPLELEFEGFALSHFLVAVDGLVELELEAQAMIDVADEFQPEPVPLHPPLWYLFGFMAGPLPVVGAVVLEFNGGVAVGGTLSGSVDARVDASAGVRLGAEYNADIGWAPIAVPSIGFESPVPAFQLDGEAGLKVYVKPEIKVLFYGVVGPYLDVEPYMEFGGSFDLCRYAAELNAGVTSDVGVRGEILDFNLIELFPTRVLDWRTEPPLWQDSGTLLPSLEVAVNPIGAGLVAVSPDEPCYFPGTLVTLAAQPSLGYGFDYWTGVDSSDGPMAYVTVDNDRSVTAYFAIAPSNQPPIAHGQQVAVPFGTVTEITLIATDPDDGPEGLTYGIVAPPAHGNLSPILNDTVTYTPDVGFTGSDGFTFRAYDGQDYSSLATVSITVSGIQTHLLSLFRSGGGAVRVGSTLRTLPWSGSFDAGSTVSLEALPDSGWSFSHWSGDLSGSTNPTVLSMSSNKNVTAHFEQDTQTYVLNLFGNGSGQVLVNGTLRTLPWSGSFDAGSTVSLEALPDSGWSFSHWSGDLSGTTNPSVLLMDADKTVTALFEQIPGNVGNLFVSSLSTDSVIQYDGTTGDPLGVFASGGGLDGPLDLTFGPNGNLFVVGSNSANVVEYDGNTGAFVREFVQVGTPGLNFPRGLTFGPNGNLFVTVLDCTPFCSGGRVLEYNGTTGSFVGVFVPEGEHLSTPEALVFAPNNVLLICSAGNNRLVEFDGGTGVFLRILTSGPSSGGGLAGPTDIVFPDAGGTILVTNHYMNATYSNSVVEFDIVSGDFLGAFVEPDAGGLVRPNGITYGPNGNLYVTSQTDSILEYSGTDGSFVRTFVSSGSGGLATLFGLVFKTNP